MLTIKEVCQLTQLSRKTVYRRMSEGVISYTQINGKRLVSPDSIAHLIVSTESNSVSNVSESECVKLRQSVDILTQKIDQLISMISSQNSVTVSQVKIKNGKVSDNEKRAQDARERVFKLLESYSNKVPSVAQMHRDSGIDRGTISKYLKEWNKINNGIDDSN